MTRSHCLIAGASGLIGSHLTEQLVRSNLYESIFCLVRRRMDRDGVVSRVTDFDDLTASLKDIRVKDIFCCLGTTLRKAGSQQAFRQVDFTYPLELAKWGRASGAKRYFLISSIGADPASRVFYNRVKGEVEGAVGALSFDSFCVLRPSLLLGTRNEFRPGERLAQIIMPVVRPLLRGKAKKYRAIRAETVARAMIRLAARDDRGWKTYESNDIENLAGEDEWTS